MKNFYSRLLIGLSLLLCLNTRVKSEIPVDSALASALQDKIEGYITQHNIPGISVTVFLPGERVWSGAAGLSHIYNMTPMDTSHLFELASVSKMYTAAIIFQLMEEGYLSLDDTVGKFLPAMNNIPSGITIENLLMMKSGLYNFTNNNSIANEWFTNPDSIWPHLQMINTFVTSPPGFPQGATYQYCNTNFFLLGMIIEEITGNTFADELRSRILIPHGLSNIYFPPEDSIPATNTPGWTSFTTPGVYDTDAAPILNDCSRSMAYTAGAIVAKPADACKFTKLLWTGHIISDSSLNIMKQCTNVALGANGNGYGYGTMRYLYNGKVYYGHAGDISGFTQLTFYGTTDSVGLIISINRNTAPRGPIAIDLMSFINQTLITSTANLESDGFDLSVFPNPAKDNISLKFNSAEKRNIEISVVDQFGRIVRNNVKYTATGNDTYTVDVSGLSAGIYHVQLNTDNRKISRKIVLIDEN